MTSRHTTHRAIALLAVVLVVSVLAGCRTSPTATTTPPTTAPTMAATALPEATPAPEATRGYPLPSDGGATQTPMAYPLPMEGATMTPVAYPTVSD